MYIGLPPLPVTVTTRIIRISTCFVGDTFYLQLLTITRRGGNPKYTYLYIYICYTHTYPVKFSNQLNGKLLEALRFILLMLQRRISEPSTVVLLLNRCHYQKIPTKQCTTIKENCLKNNHTIAKKNTCYNISIYSILCVCVCVFLHHP